MRKSTKQRFEYNNFSAGNGGCAQTDTNEVPGN